MGPPPLYAPSALQRCRSDPPAGRTSRNDREDCYVRGPPFVRGGNAPGTVRPCVSPSLPFSATTVGLCSGLGVTAGAHRLWAHRSYRARLPMRVLLAVFQTLAFQNHIHEWVRDHRVHHKYSDTNADPHNSTRGFFFSHIGWLMVRKHPDVSRKGRAVRMDDLEADPVVMWQKK